MITGALGGWFTYDDRQMVLPGWFRESMSVGDVRIGYSRLFVIGVAVVALIAILTFLQRTKHGLIIRAGVENRTMVRALGIPVDRSFTLVFALGAALATLAGVLAGIFYNSVNPTVGASQLVIGFVVVIVGGFGSVVGALYAGVLVAFIEVFGDFYIGSSIGRVMVVAMLAVILVVRPSGLLGRRIT
jgi:branched-chain amino acid transport system permease protein